MKKGRGWYATFVLLVVASFIAIYVITGQDALGAAGRFLWNGLVLVANGIIRLGGSLMELLARGVGWRRMSRLVSGVTAVGLGYAASVVVSDGTVVKARGWRGKLQAAVQRAREMWQSAPLVLKLLVVAGLIASQVYLHFLLVVFRSPSWCLSFAKCGSAPQISCSGAGTGERSAERIAQPWPRSSDCRPFAS